MEKELPLIDIRLALTPKAFAELLKKDNAVLQGINPSGVPYVGLCEDRSKDNCAICNYKRNCFKKLS
jgi:hypothetical protein